VNLNNLGNTLKKNNIEIPSVYRYLPKKYVDEFFSSGKLRLSAFSEFAKHNDEQRRDLQEGRLVFEIPIPSQQIAIRVRGGAGRKSYILSTSLREDIELMQAFRTDSYFKINNVIEFSMAIASKIMGCTNLKFGCCKYLRQRLIQRDMRMLTEKELEMISERKIDRTIIREISSRVLEDAIFIKLIQYSHQQEYRLTWHVNHEVHEPLYVECREAIQFCQRII